MPTVAEQLRAERERQKRSVHDVADATNIKTDHIRALESGDWPAFGAPVYIRGFTRTYAKELRLDVPRLMSELEAELARGGEFSEPPSLTGRRKGPLDFLTLWLSRVRWQWVFPLAIGVVVLIVLWIGIKSWNSGRVPDASTKSRPSTIGSGLYPAPRAPASGQTLPLPTNAAPVRPR
jgi:cytoskeletal protein RodZ